VSRGGSAPQEAGHATAKAWRGSCARDAGLSLDSRIRTYCRRLVGPDES
jgi:hypothetical protein